MSTTRKRPDTKGRKAPTGSKTLTAPGHSDIVKPNEVLLRMVGEITASRIRHRALLTILEESGVVDYGRYYEAYLELHHRDAAGLFAKMVLTEEAFQKRFSDWQQRIESGMEIRLPRSMRDRDQRSSTRQQWLESDESTKTFS